MVMLELSQDYLAEVDEQDFASVSVYKWRVLKTRNTIYAITQEGFRSPTILLHRLILNIDDPLIEVDHRDKNGLNCRRSNLRQATRQQNAYNRTSVQGENGSGFRGVKQEPSGKFRAYISNPFKQREHLGMFDTAEEAAHTYDYFARRYHGSFATLNFGDSYGSK